MTNKRAASLGGNRHSGRGEKFSTRNPAFSKRQTVTCNFRATKMNRHQYKNLTIQVLDEPTYKYGSVDNNFNYSKTYFGDNAEQYPTSKHGIKIYQGDHVIASCIIIGSGGATGIHQNSSIADNDQLVVCCCDTVFSLALPDLALKWKTQADLATCFQIIKHQGDYIVLGELQVTKLDKDGNKKWEFGGADIFVSIDHDEEFKIESDGILLTDFAKTKYKINFDGKLLWSTHKRREKIADNSTLPKTGRTWLQKLFGN